ncbi:hypothetical protein [Natronococcus wangiae]|uniref:hypothetical protein n=1 Tax=Natronococcus wangiae TaxID=3068275 RepID=UPI00273DB364|nr:hypothetical protein [Natronococcus sp. AD5]
MISLGGAEYSDKRKAYIHMQNGSTMNTLRRRHFTKLGSIAGVTALSGCLDVIGDVTTNRSEDARDDLGLSISSSGSGCLQHGDDIQSGWVHTVADGDTDGMTFDVRVSHRQGEEVDANLTTTPTPSEYALKFTIEESSEESDERDKPISDSDCDTGTRLKGGGSIPDDFEVLQVTINDKALKTIEREGTFGTLHPLPDPIKPDDQKKKSDE